MEYVDASLRRKIKPGNAYDRFFASSRCKVTYLGNGDTDHTLDKMSVWATKHADQVKKLALAKFSGKSLGTTIEGIHRFLFWHIQYKMDGVDQRLKSPACAWATRRDGLDCKGFSIFASAILQNLGIKHYFKKVKQPFFEPELWSHVYVIVPKDQKGLGVRSKQDYWVIDATLQSNREVPYTESNIRLMETVSLPHYGLAAPGLSGCSCSEKARPVAIDYSKPQLISTTSLIKTPLVFEAMKAAAPDQGPQIAKALENFELFLADLVVNKNLPVHTANRAMERLRMFVDAGIEPTIKDLFAVPLTEKKAKGLGITAPLLTNVNQLPSSSSYFTTSGSRSGSGLLDTAASSIPFGSTAKSLISAIVPKDLFDKTFGAIFANGFNLKCWGATWNPKRAETEFVKDAEKVKARLQQVLSTPVSGIERAINEFWVWFYGLRSTQRDWLNTSARDCTRDGLEILIGSHDGLAAQTKNTIGQVLTSAGHQITSSGTLRKTYPPEDTGRHALTYDVPQYKVTLGTGNKLSNSFVDRNNNLVISRTNGNTDNTAPLPNTGPQTAGFFGGDNFWKVALLAGGAIAVGAMFFKDSKPMVQNRAIKQK